MATVTRMRRPTLAVVCFTALAALTFAAFFVTQRLKDSDPVVKRIGTPLFVSPNGDGRKDTANIFFRLPKGDDTTVSIIDAGGDEVRRLVDDRSLHAGLHTVVWDGRDPAGKVPPDGPYYVRITLRNQGRSVTAPRPITMLMAKPHPRIQSVAALPNGTVRIRYTGAPSSRPVFIVWRTDVGAPQPAWTFSGIRGRQLRKWRTSGRPLPPGDYALSISGQNKAGVEGTWPAKLPPARDSAAPGTGIYVPELELAPPPGPVRAGQVARVAVAGPARRFRWALTRVGALRPLVRGQGSGHSLPVRIPGRAKTGVYTLAVTAAGHVARAPIAVRSGAPARVLVVLPALAWQGRNAADGDNSGFTETLDDSARVGVDRPFAGGRPPARFAQDVAPLARYLGGRAYDLTTDLALARGDGPRPDAYRGILFAGEERWTPTNVNRELRRYVDGGGRVAFLGGEAFRRRVTVTSGLLADPSTPDANNVFGERTSAARTSPAPLARFRDGLGLFAGTDGLVGQWQQLEASDGLVPGARLETAAGRDPRRPALVGYRLGRGVVVRVGVPGWASALGTDLETRKVTDRIWALLSR
jgi:hypothetical protein